MNLNELKEIGLTNGEVKLYEALLDLGESTRTTLAKKSGISPSKIYDVANRLLEKGIISSVKKNGIIHFRASDPRRIKDYLEAKQSEINNQKKLIDSMLPTLLAKYADTEESQDVEVFYGWEGMKTAFDDIINTLTPKDSNYVFGASQGFDSEMADIFFDQYSLKREKNQFATKIIFNEEVRKNKRRTAPFSQGKNEMRFLHNDTFTEINLYANKVLIIMLISKPIVIKVTSKEAADAFKKFFDSMWKIAKK
ncbi:helix-turn-helix domain-containing protein [Candidatus Woesearchaeota archaeon]|nr:helix-turn-helix domain-containing protein [Candidatus Woesearchaeota archaeon]